ncbi:hypothetical protein [Paraburkholderia phytofirmans]|uniref:Uncharacterized protein n=1 Tax=Paraburkholderia phytofirmans TaxID=261302 RepID=A0ABW9BU37_9BURK
MSSDSTPTPLWMQFDDAAATMPCNVTTVEQPSGFYAAQIAMTNEDPRYIAWWNGLPSGTIISNLPAPVKT